MFTQSEAIQILTSILRSEHPDVEVGAGLDDVGVLKFTTGQLAITVDYTNFQPLGAAFGASSLSNRGYFLIIHNVSDLIASGAKPLAGVVALGLPLTLGKQDIRELGEGIRVAADECGVAIVGGDTKEAPCLALSATLFGRLGRGGHWARSAARSGDSVFLSGKIGATSSAVLALKNIVSDVDVLKESRRVLDRPQLPLSLAEKLRDAEIRVAAIDLSDGLGLDSHRLAEASGVGLRICSTKIPLHPLAYRVANILNIDPVKLAFGCGGDAQFLFAVDPKHEDAVVAVGGVKIGTALASREKILSTPQKELPLPTFGHEDFTGETLIDRLLRVLSHPL